MEVRMSSGIKPHGKVAVVKPNTQEVGQMYVLHPQIVEPRLRQIAEIIGGMRANFNQQRFMELGLKKSELQTAQTAHRLAEGYNHLIVSVADNGKATVEDGGKIA